MFNIGQTIKVKKNNSGHNYTIGKKYKIIATSGTSAIAKDLETGFIGNFLENSDVDIIYTKEYEIKMMKECEDELRQIQLKRDYLKENNIKHSDEKTYHLYMIKKVLNSDKSEEDKISEITPLMKKII